MKISKHTCAYMNLCSITNQREPTQMYFLSLEKSSDNFCRNFVTKYKFVLLVADVAIAFAVAAGLWSMTWAF